MTQEEKSLLLQDLCARLPYGVMVNAQYKDGEGWKTEDRKLLGLYTDGQVYIDCVYTTIDCIKPYLRPMSSMTEEEKKELGNFVAASMFASQNKNPLIQLTREALLGDFFNKHHFDYRGLIPMGLALEVTEENNPYK